MIYALPFIGWLIGFVLHVSLAVPFWWCWNDLAPIYFYWLPAVYLSLPFWSIVKLFIILSILKSIFYPRFNSTTEVKTDEPETKIEKTKRFSDNIDKLLQ